MSYAQSDSKQLCRISRSAGILVNILEHQDRALFPLLAPFVAGYFFPGEDKIKALIDMYGVIVISLMLRPLGAIFFGWLGDRKGRKVSLLWSLLGMSISTLALAFIPSYAQVGSWSSLMLFFLRCSQNFFGAGESVSGGIYVMEHTKKQKQGFISALFEASTMLGVVIASMQTALFASLGILETHWQWLCFFSGGLGLILLVLRKQGQESPEYQKPFQSISWKVLWEEKKALLAVAVTTGFGYATYLLSIRFMNTYLLASTNMDATQLTTMNTSLTILDLLLLPLFGIAALYIPAGALMTGAAMTAGVISLPLFIWMMASKTVYVILLVRVIIVVIGVLFAAPSRAWLQALVSPDKRCTVLNMGSAIGQLTVEGPLTLFSLILLQQGTEWVPGLCLAILGLGSAYMIRKMRA